MQCYAVMKILLKEFIKVRCSPQSQVLCSYFIKTFLFWEVELKDSDFWRRDNFRECITYLIIRFFECLREGVIRHYFFPEFNLLSIKLTREAQIEILHLLDIAIQNDIGIIKECRTLRSIWTEFLAIEGNMNNIMRKLERTNILRNDECMMYMYCTLKVHMIPRFPRANILELIQNIDNCPCKTELKSLTVNDILSGAIIPHCTPLQYQGNKDVYVRHRVANNAVLSFDISTCKLWFALVLLKERNFLSCIRTVNDMLSCIPPFALYMCVMNRSSPEAKTFYIERYFRSEIPVTKKASMTWLFDLYVFLNNADILPLAIQIEMKFMVYDSGRSMRISPFVLAYLLMFLCYHELRQYDERDRALRQLVEVVNDPHRDGNETYCSMNIAGHCLLMVGERSRARDMFIRSYAFTLINPPHDKYNSALHYLQCLSQ